MNIFEYIEKKFEGKTDKCGDPYVFHLYRVAKNASNSEYMRLTETEKNEVYKIGLLHDILEDTDTTVDELKTLDYISNTVIDAVVALTRSKEETYNEYIERVGNNRLATVVKLHDLKDNMDITRYTDFKDISLSLLERYHKAYSFLFKQLFKLENKSN
jgi:(p)ppGpp synthase/HD superfamily hydrolase